MLLLLCGASSLARAESGEPGLEEMIGQMLMVGFRGTSVTEADPIVQDIAQGRVGGVILFEYDVVLKKHGRNITGPDQVKALVASLKKHAGTPLFIAVDEEGGRVSRFKASLGFPETLSAAELGKRNDPAFTRTAGAGVGQTLAALGLNLDFAPVVDLNVNPDNPVIGKLDRSFSPDPGQVALHAKAFIEGLNSRGVLSCVKHFPGHGSAWNDSHVGMADVTETWTEKELAPYADLMAGGKVDMIMTAHVFNANLDPDHPATLSRAVIQGLLRDKMGYDGVVVSDDMQMRAVSDYYGLEQAVRLALGAGVDILLFPNNNAYDPEIATKARDLILAMIEDGTLDRARIERSYARIMKLKKRLP